MLKLGARGRAHRSASELLFLLPCQIYICQCCYRDRPNTLGVTCARSRCRGKKRLPNKTYTTLLSLTSDEQDCLYPKKTIGFFPQKLSRLPELSKIFELSITAVSRIVPFILKDYSHATHHTFKNAPNWTLEHHISVLLLALLSRTVCLCSEATSL